jgi:hypothetical protein
VRVVKWAGALTIATVLGILSAMMIVAGVLAMAGHHS